METIDITPLLMRISLSQSKSSLEQQIAGIEVVWGGDDQALCRGVTCQTVPGRKEMCATMPCHASTYGHTIAAHTAPMRETNES
jgi:hypothetical protein